MNSYWSYSRDTAKLGLDLSDLDLWPLTLTCCMDIWSTPEVTSSCHFTRCQICGSCFVTWRYLSLKGLYFCTCSNSVLTIPVGTWRKNNVIITSKRRNNDVIFTSCVCWDVTGLDKLDKLDKLPALEGKKCIAIHDNHRRCCTFSLTIKISYIETLTKYSTSRWQFQMNFLETFWILFPWVHLTVVNQQWFG